MSAPSPQDPYVDQAVVQAFPSRRCEPGQQVRGVAEEEQRGVQRLVGAGPSGTTPTRAIGWPKTY